MARKPHVDPELNIIPFLNVMVVLIAFLLVNAVFAAIAVLNVNLPAAQGAGGAPTKTVTLEVQIKPQGFVVDEQSAGALATIPQKAGQYDYEGLRAEMIALKAKYPTVSAVTLLSEPTTKYQTLIHVMDAVRYQSVVVAGKQTRQPLFPDMALGSTGD